MAKYNFFGSPGNNPDFGADANLAGTWSSHMKFVFKTSIGSLSAYLARHGSGYFFALGIAGLIALATS